MKSTVVCYPIDEQVLRTEKYTEPQSTIETLESAGDKVLDIKVNHFNINDEYWVQYTILSEEGV